MELRIHVIHYGDLEFYELYTMCIRVDKIDAVSS